MSINDGCRFSTASLDNDMASREHIANSNEAPWWFCLYADVMLTGFRDYGQDSENASDSGIRWMGPWGIRHMLSML